MHRGGPPLLPPRATRPVQSDTDVPWVESKLAGALYAPGQWPTPELSLSPVGRYSVLADPSTYTSDAIQSALNALGPSSTLYLPQATVWVTTKPLQLFEHQELSTWGYPASEADMARLEAAEECYPYIVCAQGKSGASLRNIVVDGGRERYGYNSKCGVMLQFGHLATNQVVDRCIIRHPRHWSCIQAFEGSQNVRITNNVIGPAGIGADKESGKWADGISFAGANGLVAGNKIQDATDGAIVVFGAPGTLITSNTIISRERQCLGGINMVDWEPHGGNYRQTRVTHNTIITQGRTGYIKTGIGQGPSVWWSSHPSDQKFNRGAVVSNNLIDFQDVGLGQGFVGYGFAVASDVREWICTGNQSTDRVQYQGDISQSLPMPNVAPGPFVHDIPPERLRLSGSASVSVAGDRGEWVILQPDFSNRRGRIKSLISILPGASRVLSYLPGQFRLERGRSIALNRVILGYEQDGVIRIRELDGGTGRVLWESDPNIQAPTPGKYLAYSAGGKLCLFGSSEADIYFDLTPHLSFHESPGNYESYAPTLVFSDANPHLSITIQASSVLFSSSYIFAQNRAFPGGQVVARTSIHGNSPRTVLYTLSPYCQFVVLRSKKANSIVPALPLVWPAVEQEPYWDWEIVWTTPNARTKERRIDAIMYFQGDGNLVIRSWNTVPWASGSHGKSPPATHMRFGVGTVTEPWIEIVDSEGGRVWSS